MWTYLIICSLLAAAAGMAGVIKQLHMLQQNSYFLSRYLKWVKEDTSNYIYVQCAVCAVMAIFIAFKMHFVSMVALAVFTVVTAYLNIKGQKKAIKPLVFTKRIIRTLSLCAGLLLILALLFIVFKGTLFGIIILTVLLVLGIFPETLALVCSLIMMPVEKSITKGFIKDAKRILSEHKNLTIVGVTGSYGKTSFKFILAKLLSQKYNVLATPQSFNTPMGVVRTIREMLRPQIQIFVCEMGAKNVGDIKEICDIVNPDMGVITSVGEQHLETFKSLENICSTKFELYDAVMNKGGKVFANTSSAPINKRKENGANILAYSTEKTGDVVAANIKYSSSGSSFDIVFSDGKIPVTTKLLGAHNVINITGAAAVARELGVEPTDIAFAVSRLEPTQHRLELKPFKKGSVLIDDAYNANPEGCIEAVNVLSRFEGMKKVIITPGLVELGEKEYESNYALGTAAAKHCDVIILVGKNRSKPLAAACGDAGFNEENLFIAESFKEAMDIFTPIADENTVVLFENDLPDNYLK